MSKPESAPPERPESGPRTNPALQAAGLRQVTLTVTAGEQAVRSPSSARLDPYLGAMIDGRYSVEKVLGEGGMGVVYRCRHTIIDKLVAMKVLRADMARNEEVTERFLNEARSASSIGNPHIIDISDFGRLPDGATYFIMEFLDGAPLSSVLDEHAALPPERLLKIGHQLAEGLAAAHERGIVHRDLKPDNIFLLRRGAQADFVKILDFGIAKASASTSKLTQAGQVFGTPHYMSPEQAAGTAVDHRSDIYALGVIFYEMASGRLPFDADNFMAILTHHMYKAPTPLRQLADLTQEVSPELEAVILKCLAKRPEDRYQSMADLGSDLHKLQGGHAPAALRPNGREPRPDLPPGFLDAHGGRRSAPSRLRLTLLSLAAVVTLGALGLWFVRSSAAPPATASLALGPELTPAPPPTPHEPPAAPVANPELKRTVAIAVAPLDAHVFRSGEDLGPSPVVIEVGADTVELEVRSTGYEPKLLLIDGSQPKISVVLDKSKPAQKKPGSAASSAAKPTTKPAVTAPTKPKKPGSDLIVNPWD